MPPFHQLKKHFKALSCLALTTTLSTECLAARPAQCTRNGRQSKAADFGKKAMPIGALAVSAIKLDWYGALMSQVLSAGLYGANKPLEKKIKKKRPCGCSGAFPSGHMIMFATSASLLHYRYGWQYGLPAYAIALGFSADRVKNKAHSWGDMLGTAAIVNLITYIVTPRFTPDVEYLPPFLWDSLSSDEEEGATSPQKPLLIRPSLNMKRRVQAPLQLIPLFNVQKTDKDKNYTVGFVVRF